MDRRVASVMLLGIVALLGVSTPGEATLPGRNGNLAYDLESCDTGCEYSVQTVSPQSGSRPHYVGAGRNVDDHDIYFQFAPAFAPGGSRIAFVGIDVVGLRAWVAVGTLASRTSSTLTSVVPIIKDRYARSPQWSPTGRSLLYDSQGRRDAIVEVDLRSGHTSRIGPRFPAAPGPVYELQPDWASTGEIVMSSGTGTESDGNARLVVMSARGRRVRTLTTGYFDTSPSWSPDGKKLAFTRGNDANDPCPRVYTIRADGRALKQITDGCHTSVAWSPDGTKIAVVRDGNKLEVMPAAGGLARQIATGGPPVDELMENLDWQPLPR